VDSKENSKPAVARQAFTQYWYAGKAEINRYELNQARYGEMRKGDAVLIFVTEDFLRDKQVKYEFGDKRNAVPVLKLNFARKFYTGIYPYSIMTSIFTPVEYDNESTLKVTSSSQEWCGHTFMQLNNRDDGYSVDLRSYFQAEGDQTFHVGKVLLEDEVWTRIRLNPTSLPTGKIKLIPGAQFARLKHVVVKAEDAVATMQSATEPKLSTGEIGIYTIDYADLKRTLAIKFEKEFPHRILAWEETFMNGFGKSAKMLTTTAVRTHSLMLDYWSKNKEADSHYRDELALIY